MNSNLLSKIIACSVCGADLSITENKKRVLCNSCGAIFTKGKHVWNFIPENIEWDSPMWNTWQQLQENGIASYEGDPEHNLAIVEREDIKQFSTFCDCRGLVLDVGCGPQAWPAYFRHGDDVTYVGIDPILEDISGRFLRIKALAEFLPFKTRIFDHVLFSTTLDHFVDPVVALQAAAKVCKVGGEIDVWLGEKSADAPKPAVSPEWYRRLQKPLLAEDLFHVKRLDTDDFFLLAQKVGLTIVETETNRVDEFRVNHFYRLKVGK